MTNRPHIRRGGKKGRLQANHYVVWGTRPKAGTKVLDERVEFRGLDIRQWLTENGQL